ncbi:hypothetical protein BD309DRAFT_614823 [Dichomitus squalens]|uniref:Uncharacterized protein n=1 Tax=Dichomitus squalens TaxID=114155 RepID=A0A4Q9NXD2_9APHY|nr:hypothetical protein BD311DRAFT_137740 [Dichomitus squalens]TBU46519.1 hypothetical protein BD309DRAFT_614823 [Dichomitus squalens]
MHIPVEVCENITHMPYTDVLDDRVGNSDALGCRALLRKAWRVRSQRMIFYSVRILHGLVAAHQDVNSCPRDRAPFHWQRLIPPSVTDRTNPTHDDKPPLALPRCSSWAASATSRVHYKAHRRRRIRVAPSARIEHREVSALRSSVLPRIHSFIHGNHSPPNRHRWVVRGLVLARGPHLPELWVTLPLHEAKPVLPGMYISHSTIIAMPGPGTDIMSSAHPTSGASMGSSSDVWGGAE